MSVRRLLGGAAAAAVAAVVLSGCTADVQTGFTVTGADTAQVTVSAAFTGEAAKVLATDATSRSGLIHLFTATLGQRPDLHVSPALVTATMPVQYTDLAKLAPITGVSGAQLSQNGHQIAVDVTRPVKLRQAVAAQVADQPDAAALTQTMLEQTDVIVSVTFPGGVRHAQVQYSGAHPGPKPTVDGNTVTWAQDAEHTQPGTLLVDGSPTSGRVWWWLAGGLLLAGAGAVWFRRQ